MPECRKWIIPDDLKNAFDLGYLNASTSFGILKKEAVKYNQFHGGVYNITSGNRFDQDLLKGKKVHCLITTEIFGDLSGKSYLLISEEEFDSLTRQVPQDSTPGVDLKKEFIKELDNILSAAIITELSNELQLTAYGDIPKLVGDSCSIEDLIYDDFSRFTGEVYVTAIYFSFEKEPSINPFFIWVVNTESIRG